MATSKLEESKEKLEETRDFIHQLLVQFGGDESSSVHEIVKKQSDCQKIADKRQAEAKRILKEMQAKVVAEENVLSKRTPPEIHAQRMENLERQKEAISTNILNQDKEHEALKENVESTKKEEDELKRRRKVLEDQKVPEGPTIGLYQILSNIKWDYESSHVKGYVDIIDPKTKSVVDVKPFDIDPEKHNQFWITNYLWDIMDA